MENSKPKVILLVAGEGKRLHPYTLDRPKCMVEIDGVSLIDRQFAVAMECLYASSHQKGNRIRATDDFSLPKDAVGLVLPRYYSDSMASTLDVNWTTKASRAMP